MSEPPRRDDTAYVQSFLGRGEDPPPGVYYVPGGLTFIGGGGGTGTGSDGAAGGPGSAALGCGGGGASATGRA